MDNPCVTNFTQPATAWESSVMRPSPKHISAKLSACAIAIDPNNFEVTSAIRKGQRSNSKNAELLATLCLHIPTHLYVINCKRCYRRRIIGDHFTAVVLTNNCIWKHRHACQTANSAVKIVLKLPEIRIKNTSILRAAVILNYVCVHLSGAYSYPPSQ